MRRKTCFRVTQSARRNLRLIPALLLSVSVLVTASAYGERVVSHTFDSSLHGWKTVSHRIRTGVVKNDDQGHSSLRITGNDLKSDTLAISPMFQMRGFQKYRLRAKIQWNPSFPAGAFPAISCDCLLDAKTGSLGLFASEWEGAATGNLRQAGIEFRAPWGTSAGRLMVVMKGAHSSPLNVDFRVDDVILEPIESFTRQWRLEGSLPASSAAMPLLRLRGVHPRLYLTGDSIPELKRKNASTHAEIWMKLKAQADGLLKQPPPPYPEKVADSYDEQWWQSRNGFGMSTLAFAYLMTGEKIYLDGARRWALATCRYPHWGVSWIDGMDCMTGHNLYGLSLVYDWCYQDLEPGVLEEIRKTLIRRGSAIFKAASEGNIVPNADEFSIRPWPEWEDAYLQNHLWVNASGIAAAGFALYGEYEGAESWIAFAANKFGKTMKLLGPDGASHEGINYWSYGVEHLLKYMYLSRQLLGIDLFDNSWFRNTGAFRIYAGIPSGDWKLQNTTVDYADSYRRDNTGPDFLLHALAAEYRDAFAQWLARNLDDAGVQLSTWKCLDFLWYDPSVTPQSPSSLPTMRHFSDMDIVSMRSDWSENASFVFFQCGPYIGRKALYEMPYCASSSHHTHPDRNHFVLHGAGEWLIRDDGNKGKYTGQHNTLLIDGGEQFGGGDSIFDGRLLHALKAAPCILKAEHTDSLDHVTGDATAAYPPETGLTRFHRHLIFIKPNALIVLDDIKLTNERDMELRFHPERQEVQRDGNAIFTAGEKAKLRMAFLTPDAVDISAEKLPLIDRRYVKDEFMTVRLKHHGKTWRNAVAFSWSEKSAEPVPVTLKKKGDIWIFTIGRNTVKFDWKTGHCLPE